MCKQSNAKISCYSYYLNNILTPKYLFEGFTEQKDVHSYNLRNNDSNPSLSKQIRMPEKRFMYKRAELWKTLSKRNLNVNEFEHV